MNCKDLNVVRLVGEDIKSVYKIRYSNIELEENKKLESNFFIKKFLMDKKGIVLAFTNGAGEIIGTVRLVPMSTGLTLTEALFSNNKISDYRESQG
jgi:hypothetical protein